MQIQEPGHTKIAYSVNDLLALLPLGRTSLYAAIKNGSLKATKYGKRTMFLSGDVSAFLASLPSASGKAQNA